jgi:Na+-translocating ferredoxin:NAD+ oxidoreductase RnfD subunit
MKKGKTGKKNAKRRPAPLNKQVQGGLGQQSFNFRFHTDVLTLLSTSTKLIPVAPTLSNFSGALNIAKDF